MKEFVNLTETEVLGMVLHGSECQLKHADEMYSAHPNINGSQFLAKRIEVLKDAIAEVKDRLHDYEGVKINLYENRIEDALRLADAAGMSREEFNNTILHVKEMKKWKW